MKVSATACAAALIALVAAHTLPGIESIKRQIDKNQYLLEPIYANLPREDSDFITRHLSDLTSYNGTDCEKCKHRIRYGQSLLQDAPRQQHLVSLLLFKYCIEQNDGDESKCDNVDFFVTTKSSSSQGSGVTSETSIDFYDNDFLQVLQHFNVSSDVDLEYYCYYKDSKSCDLPPLPDVVSTYGLDQWWPAKQPKHFQEPQYHGCLNETFNVLHISDFHDQLRYQLGSEANCTSNGLCCLPEVYNEDLPSQKDYNFTDVYYKLDPTLPQSLNISFYPQAHYNEENNFVKGEYYDFPANRGWDFEWLPATTFGNYECDPPEVLLNNSLKFIGGTQQAKNYQFAIFTGDIVDHDVYHCDANTTKVAEQRSYGIMKHFLQDLPVFPTLGNHDTFPYGQLAATKYSDSNSSADSAIWNSDLLSDLWTENGWIPSSEKPQIRQHYAGFATSTPQHPNLKIISLNSNCYYQKNLWAYINLEQDPDIFGQWAFLIEELVASEAKGERVWIIAHIPSGDSSDALPIQSQIFAEIVKRFSPYTIANIFFGHTHKDQFKVLYNETSHEDGAHSVEGPVNMAWISQAITPLGPSNPSWRYYEVQPQSYNIVNSINYYTPLNETFVNGGDEPRWAFEYSARATYDTQHEWPSSAPLNATFWDRFVVSRLQNESSVAFNEQYTALVHRFAPELPQCRNGSVVSSDCFNDNYCDIVSFSANQYHQCKV